MALRVLFDTNAYDAILAAGDEARIAALIGSGALSVIVTSVQEDEIRQIRSRGRRQRLLALFRRIGGRRIAPAEAIGGDIAFMARDEILARLAEACCDLLVTDDSELRQRCRIAVAYSVFSKDVLGN